MSIIATDNWEFAFMININIFMIISLVLNSNCTNIWAFGQLCHMGHFRGPANALGKSPRTGCPGIQFQTCSLQWHLIYMKCISDFTYVGNVLGDWRFENFWFYEKRSMRNWRSVNFWGKPRMLATTSRTLNITSATCAEVCVCMCVCVVCICVCVCVCVCA